ncbi:MAG: 50S ribosomal protein L1, partial [Bacteroidia bacterium]
VSFDKDKIYENAKELIDTLTRLKPSAAKGIYFQSITMSSTMSPGIKVDPKSIA